MQSDNADSDETIGCRGAAAASHGTAAAAGSSMLCGSTISQVLHGSTMVWLPWFSFSSHRGNLGTVKFHG